MRPGIHPAYFWPRAPPASERLQRRSRRCRPQPRPCAPAALRCPPCPAGHADAMMGTGPAAVAMCLGSHDKQTRTLSEASSRTWAAFGPGWTESRGGSDMGCTPGSNPCAGQGHSRPRSFPHLLMKACSPCAPRVRSRALVLLATPLPPRPHSRGRAPFVQRRKQVSSGSAQTVLLISQYAISTLLKAGSLRRRCCSPPYCSKAGQNPVVLHTARRMPVVTCWSVNCCECVSCRCTLI